MPTWTELAAIYEAQHWNVVAQLTYERNLIAEGQATACGNDPGPVWNGEQYVEGICQRVDFHPKPETEHAGICADGVFRGWLSQA